MDPATGASTWAFGSHKWREKIGTLTKKANMQNKAEMFEMFPSDWIEDSFIDRWCLEL